MTVGSIAEYARYRLSRGLSGGSQGGVTKAILNGRIRSSKDPITNRVTIEFEQADIDWTGNSSPSMMRSGIAGGKARTASNTERMEAKVQEATGQRTSDKGDFNQSRSNREFYDSELARLKFEEKNRSLIPVETVKKLLYAAGRVIRAGHEDIVSQLAPDCASETSIEAVEKMLKKALEDLDNRLADTIAGLNEKIGADEEEESEENEDAR